MTAATPRTVEQYLDLLRAELQGADPALVQDALYDAEEHLRAELAQNPGATEEAMLAPHRREVWRTGRSRRRLPHQRSARAGGAAHAAAEGQSAPRSGASSAVYADPRAYLSLAYMLLALATGILYFVFAVTGSALTVGPRGPDHRRAVLPVVHRYGARAGARGRPHRRIDARHAHAAPAGASRARGRLVDAHRRDAEGPAHLGHAALPVRSCCRSASSTSRSRSSAWSCRSRCSSAPIVRAAPRRGHHHDRRPGAGPGRLLVASDFDLGDSAAHRHAASFPGHRLSSWPVGEIPARPSGARRWTNSSRPDSFRRERWAH